MLPHQRDTGTITASLLDIAVLSMSNMPTCIETLCVLTASFFLTLFN